MKQLLEYEKITPNPFKKGRCPMTEPVYIREGFANMLKGKEGVGGKLYLDENMLHHMPHAINIQREETAVLLKEVASVERVRNRLLGIPMLNNCLKVTLHSGLEVQYVVNKAGQWVEDVERAVADAKKSGVV